MAENWVDERDKAILETIYYCENCNMVLEPRDIDVEQHKKDLPHHKMRKVFIVRCGHCGNIVTDSHAQYSPRKEPVLVQELHSRNGSPELPHQLALPLYSARPNELRQISVSL